MFRGVLLGLALTSGLTAHALGATPSSPETMPGAGRERTPDAGRQAQAGSSAPALSVPMPSADAGTPRASTLDLPSAVPPAEGTAPASAPRAAETRQVVLSLRQLGAQGPLALRGVSELQGVQFGIRSDEVVTGATLKLRGAMSPSLMAQFSNVTVTLNEQYVGTIPATEGQTRFEGIEMPVDPVFFAEDNRLNFRFVGRYAETCNDPLSGLLWSTVSDTSTLTLTLVRLPPQRDLSRLPLPFFEARDRQQVVLPFVIQTNPANEVLESSGIVSSWFGQMAGFRGASFPVSASLPASRNGIVVATADTLPPGLGVGRIEGPTIAIVPNPNDASGSLLLVAGRNGQELVSAARALVVSGRTLGGQQAVVGAPVLAKRKPYDAPAWIPTDRPVRFGELVDPSELQATGYAPGALRVPFRTAPDLYTWRRQGFPAEIRYRAPPGPIVDLAVSRLDVGINNIYLASMPLAEDATRRNAWLPSVFQREDVRQVLNSGDASTARRIDVPAYDVFGQNALQFTFDTRPLGRGACAGIPGDLRMAVDPDSTIDFSRANRITSLPNLAFFVNSGFPFSRMADLSETAIVVPPRADLREVQAFLDLMGRLGSQTGHPATGVAVVRPDQVAGVSDRDLLMVGTLERLQSGADLLRTSPVRLEGDRIRIALSSPIENMRRALDFGREDRREAAQSILQGAPASSFAALIGAESPLARGRSLVAIVAGGTEALQGVVPTLNDAEQAPKVQGDLAILTDGRPASYRVGDTYTVGQLPYWLYPSWYFQDSPLGLVAVLLIGSAMLGLVLYRALRRRARARMREIES
ncbi:cellulose synthase subunit [Methylobacterium sp. ap11]|uniref:cellulose biosynthesis cyclic di-GMP-binding regulatory protein BcsB n=1 Tax=Methylobacterium sp. ap11 TaxID=1761799 RepID=UPI0008C0F378|nr:cellulose biosynthesis cyclic di-GMP-binding regulatory protein BcsB [Methylobacterium sp. ap11]SEP44008.1 cellulose synthase subunit [Methylobacterium sp. ap11]